jgi:hypothetical protein
MVLPMNPITGGRRKPRRKRTVRQSPRGDGPLPSALAQQGEHTQRGSGQPIQRMESGNGAMIMGVSAQLRLHLVGNLIPAPHGRGY